MDRTGPAVSFPGRCTGLVLLLVFLLFAGMGCSDKPSFRIDRVEIESVTRSFPDRDDWLHVVAGRVFVRFDRDVTSEMLEKAHEQIGVSLFVYTKGNPNPGYFLQYTAGDTNNTRIAKPYEFEKSAEEKVYMAGWELTDVYFGDQEFNDGLYDAVAVAAETQVLDKLIQFMDLESLLNLPNMVDARLVFSDPFRVERGTTTWPAGQDSLSWTQGAPFDTASSETTQDTLGSSPGEAPPDSGQGALPDSDGDSPADPTQEGP